MGNRHGQIKNLIRQRGSIKSKPTRFKKFTTEFKDHNDEFQLRERNAKMVLDFEQLEIVQSRIELIVSDDEVEIQLKERAEFEEAYFECISNANKILSKETVNSEGIQIIPLTSQSTSNSIQSSFYNNNNQHIISTHNIETPSLINTSNSPTESNSNEHVLLQSIINGSHIKLPTIRLATFSGAYEMWPSFADSFQSAVHDNRTLRIPIG